MNPQDLLTRVKTSAAGLSTRQIAVLAAAFLAVVGIVIAALALMPEGLAAVKAALGNRLQTSLNVALGSALATIGLTIPAVAMVS